MIKLNKVFMIYVVFIITTGNNNSNQSLAATSKKYNRFLAHIFNKYGNGGTMSFEGLEHLMYNLGIGGLEFNPTHTIEEHHPNGYKLPDLVINSEEDDINSDDIIQNKLQIQQNDPNNRIISEPNSQENNIQYGFKELHDPKHRHPKDHDKHEIPNYCLSPQATLKLVIDHDDIHNYQIYRKQRDLTSTLSPLIKNNRDDLILNKYSDHNREDEYIDFLNIIKITPEIFMKLCPALLVQMDQNSCTDIHDDVRIKSDYNRNPNSLYYAWIYASVAIFILSACGLIGVAMVPLMKSIAYKEILRFLVAVAVGTLAGDALMHLLPHALSTDHSSVSADKSGHNHNEPVLICACTFLTICFMYFLENLLPVLLGREPGHGHSHGGGGPPSPQIINQKIQSSELQINNLPSSPPDIKEINTMMNENMKDLKTGNTISKPMTPVAFMVVLGDGLHNLTDGLAIGASFAADPVTGMATAFAVLCHELPHELGDFALLLQTGMSIKRAIYLNIVSSVLSFMGMAIGLLIVDLHTDMVKWIYACTAGSFLYIAMATLIPEMGRNDGKALKNVIIQIFGILIGGIIMLWIGLNEDRLTRLFQ